MQEEFTLLNDSEVLHVLRGRILMSNPTFRVSEFLDALAQLISEQEMEWTEDAEGWFSDGLDCEALRLGNQGWQRGRVRLRLEFSPAPQPRLLQGDVQRREEPMPDREDIYFRAESRRRPGRNEVYDRDDIYLQDPDPYPDELDLQ